MNNYAISTSDLASSLMRSSGALVAANTSLEEAVALTASANTIIQDPESVGNALKTISMRIRGVKSELEDAGEETDGLITNTSKLQAKVEALTNVDGKGGINILTDTGEFKSIYQIMVEIGKVWQDMNDMSKAALLEILAGKQRSSVVSALLNDADLLEQVYNSAMNSAGSATHELDVYLSSIQGHLDKFTNAVQTMWMNAINSDVVKFFVDCGTAVMNFIDKVGLLNTALVTLVGYIVARVKFGGILNALGLLGTKLTSISGIIASLKHAFSDTSGFAAIIKEGKTFNGMLLNTIEFLGLSDTAFGKYIANVIATATAEVAATGATGTLSVAFVTLKVAILQAAAALKAFALAHPIIAAIVAIAAGITAAVVAIDALTTSHKEYVEQLKDTNQELEDLRSNIDSLNSELETTKERIEELENKGPLTLTEQEELEKLKAQNAELERQIQLEEAREERARNRQAEQAAGAFKSDKDFKPVMNISGRIPVVTATNEFEDYLNDIEDSKKKLDEAEQALQDAVNSGMDTESKKFKKLEKNLDEAQSDYIQAQTDWDDFMAEKEETYGDLEWFDNPKTEAQKAVNEFLSAMENYTDRAEILFGNVGAKESAITRLFGERGSEAGQAFNEAFNAKVESGEIDLDVSKFEDYSSTIDDVTNEVENLIAQNPQLKLQLDSLGITAEDVARHYLKIDEAMQQTEGTMSTAITDLSTLSSAYESYASALQVANEAVFEGQAISEDYYNSLKEYLGDVTVGEEDFSDAIDSTNGYIVKNTKLLKNLINQKKKEQKATVSAAKAQSQLQYSKLVKQLQQAVKAMSLDYKAYGYVTQATYQNISAIRSQIDAVKTAIREYAILELKLSDVTNAYTEFEEAKNRDAELSYGDSMIEMLETISDGFLTGKVGSEAFKAACKALVPESVIADCETFEERLDAIDNYFENSKFADYFTIDEDGNFSIAIKNIEAFIADAKEVGAFLGNEDGTFTIADNIQDIEDLANAMGLTKEATVAMVTELSKYDASWGDIVADLTMTPLDRTIRDTTDALDQALAKQEEFFKNGKDPFGANAEEYQAIQQEIQNCSIEYSNAQKAIVDSTNAWMAVNEQVQIAQDKVSKYSNELEQLKKTGASEVAIQVKTEELDAAREELAAVLQEKYKLSEPTQMDFQITLEDVQRQIDNWKKSNAYLEATVVPKIEQDSDGVWKIPAEIEAELNEDDKQKIQEYIDLINDEEGLATLLGLVETDPAVTELVDIKGILTDIADKIGVSKSKDITNEEGANKSVKSQDLSTTNVQVPTSAAASNSSTTSSTGFSTNGVDQKVLAWNEMVYGFTEQVEQAISQILNGTIDGIENFFTETIPQAWDSFTTGAGEAIDSLIQWGSGIPEAWNQYWAGVEEWFNGVGEWASGVGEGIDTFVNETFPEVWGHFWDNVGELVTEKLPEAIGNIFNSIDDAFDDVLGGIAKFIGKAEGLKNAFLKDPIGFVSHFADEISTTFTDLLDSVFGAWNNMVDDVSAWANKHIKEPADQIIQSINNFIDSIPQRLSDMISGAGEFFDSVVGSFIQMVDNASAWVSENIYQPLANMIARMDQFFADLPQTLSNLWDSASQWFTDNVLYPLAQLQTDFYAFCDSIPGTVKQLWDNAMTYIADNILVPLVQIRQDYWDFLGSIPGIVAGLWDNIKSWISDKINIFSTNWKEGYTEGYNVGNNNSTSQQNRKSGNTIFAKGSDGLETSEHNAIVGELGRELVCDVDKGVYYTVGENGTEMVDLPKNAIIYNHKQTEELLKNGQTSRGTPTGGLSFARGNAHWDYGTYTKKTGTNAPAAWGDGSDKTWAQMGWDLSDATDSLSDAADSLSDSADDISDAFEDTINWIDVLFTRIEDVLSEQEAVFANIIDSTGGISAKESIYDSMFGEMYYKANASFQAAEYYRKKAAEEMVGLPADIQNKIKNGAISIQDFVGNGNEENDDALQEYVDQINQAIEYYDQISQYMQQYYETLEEIADKALEHQEEVATAYENEIGLVEHLNNTLEARNDLEEAKEGFATKAYYDAQIDAQNKMLSMYQSERRELQRVLDEEVALGHVKIGSQQWFDMQQAIYDVDDTIIDTEASIEDLQNAINDLYWDRFDELINRFGYLEDEISNVIELLSHDPDGLIMEELRDLTTTNWANGSGLATLGLYAQQMEEAQYVANKYAEEIKELKKQYAAGRYNETEYLNKLNELISAQYENIEKYYDAKDAIVELNKARVDAIRDGIELEIDKYDELIQKKKELLNREQD